MIIATDDAVWPDWFQGVHKPPGKLFTTSLGGQRYQLELDFNYPPGNDERQYAIVIWKEDPVGWVSLMAMGVSWPRIAEQLEDIMTNFETWLVLRVL